ncbi:MAG: HD domain-containing protein, partial [Planctomycetes bacterium]|nr:HD domain-containing protein [Planctomycetota bacterium]
HQIQLASLLHDIGKLALSETDLKNKKNRGKHIQLGEKILSKMNGVQEIMPGIKYHHEKVDGTGFPGKLKGDQIPLMAKIIAVANVFDHLIAHGGLKGEGLPVNETVEEIAKQGGTEFDSPVADALKKCHQAGTLFKTFNFFEN